MDNVALDVIIGLVFIYLLFSILLTSFCELVINNFLGLRGKNLDVAVKSAFGASGGSDTTADGLVDDFFHNGLVFSLFEDGRKPSELPPDLFSKAYLAVLGKFSGPADRPRTPAEFLSKLRQDINLPNHDKIVGALDPLLSGTEASWEGFERNVANWFGDVGQRSRGWYKRKIDRRMLVLAFLLALACNVDTLFIVRMLQIDKQNREQLANQAAQYVAAEGKAIAKSEAVQSPDAQRRELWGRFKEEMKPLDSMDKKVRESPELRALQKRCVPLKGCYSNPYDWYTDLTKIDEAVRVALTQQDGTNAMVIQETLKAERSKLLALSSDMRKASRDSVRKEEAEIKKMLFEWSTATDGAAWVLKQQTDTDGGPVLAADAKSACEAAVNGAGDSGQAQSNAADKALKRCIELYKLATAGQLGFPVGWSPELREFQKVVAGGGWVLGDDKMFWISPLNVLGLLLTTLALILGAPFWFDVLRRLVPLRQIDVKTADSPSGGAAAGSTADGSGATSQPAVGVPPAGSAWFADAVNDTERRLSPDVIRQIQQRLDVSQITGRLDRATRDAIYLWRQRRRPGAEPSWEIDESMVNELLWKTSDPLSSGQPGLPAVTALPASDGPMPDLKLGSRSAEVTRLRGLLAANGFIEATASGSDEFDEALDRAVKDFQKKHSLAYDGTVGPVSWLKLSNDPDQLPAAYASPPWMARAIHEMGVTEIAGVGKDNLRIIEYQRVTNSTLGDETAWCSSFVNWVIKDAGLEPTGSATASSWRNWGTETPARYGAVIVIIGCARPDPGTGPGAHVGFLVRETGGYYMILGGNQGGRGGADSVCVTSFPKSGWRCLATRWAKEGVAPAAALGSTALAAADTGEDIDIAPALSLVETLTEPRLQFGSGNARAVADLQQLLNSAQQTTLEVDGVFGDETRAALLDFQRAQELPLTGIADPGTWYHLRAGTAAGTRPSTGVQPRQPLSQADIGKEIIRIKTITGQDIEFAAVEAVRRVESAGRGFAGAHPLVRLEGHKLWSQAKQLGIDPAAWVVEGAGLLHEQRASTYNKTGVAEWQRLEKARLLCDKMFAGRQVPPNKVLGVAKPADLADLSASWGMFQIMGFNWKLCQQASLDDFRTKMEESEAAQLALFFNFLIGKKDPLEAGKKGALEALAQRDWATFARLYNGSSFRENRYDTKLAQYYYEAKRANP